MRPMSGLDASRHAITDLYDEERRTFLVRYPTWFIIVLSLAGVVAFAITGFLGHVNPNESPLPLDPAFQQPWLLFLWFCALLITLQVSIFRNESLRRRLIATLIISGVAIILVGVAKFGDSLPAILRQLLQYRHLLTLLAGNSWTFTLVNFGIIAIFWADTVRRWIRRARGLPPNPRVELGIERPTPLADLPTMQELISGDLIAGAVLTLLLAGIFRAEVLGLFIHAAPPAHPIDTCTMSWPLGSCVHRGGGLADPPTLTSLDLMQSLIYLPLGLVVLALSATLSGLGAVGGVNDKALEAELPALASKEESSTVPITADVAQTLINTLRSAIDRRIRILVNNLALSLRMVGWPTLIFVATYGLADLSISLQYYLHYDKSFANVVLYALPALGWGVLATLSVAFSAALMLFRWRVAENTLRFLGLVGFILLLTFWIFSLALFAFNRLLILTNALTRHPFDPSWSTGFSFAALLVFGFLLLFRRLRSPRIARAAADPGTRAALATAQPTSTTPDPGATNAMNTVNPPQTPES